MSKIPFEIIIHVLEQLSTRQLCKFATLSKAYSFEIKRIVIRRFYSAFSDPNKRLLVGFVLLCFALFFFDFFFK